MNEYILLMILGCGHRDWSNPSLHSSTFWLWERITNSLGKIIFYRLVFVFCSPAQALAAGLPRQDHFYSTTNESFVSTTKKSMKCVIIWISLRIRVRSRNTQPHQVFPTTHIHICPLLSFLIFLFARLRLAFAFPKLAFWENETAQFSTARLHHSEGLEVSFVHSVLSGLQLGVFEFEVMQFCF